MKLTSLRIITANIKTLVQFFEQVTGSPAQWYTDDFVELVSGTATLAIGSTKTMSLFGEGLVTPASNSSVIIEFRVTNVDEQFERSRISLITLFKNQPQCIGVIVHYYFGIRMAI